MTKQNQYETPIIALQMSKRRVDQKLEKSGVSERFFSNTPHILHLKT